MQSEGIPYKAVQMLIGINHETAQLLKLAGALDQERDQDRLNQRHIQMALSLKIDPFRGGRRFGDQEIPETGKPIFGHQGVANVSLIEVFTDLVELGYVPCFTSVFRTEKDIEKGRWTFQLWLTTEETSGVSAEMTQLIIDLVSQSRQVTPWDNRGTYETAAIKAGIGNKLNAKTKSLRLSPDGTFFVQPPAGAEVAVLPTA